MVSPGSAVEVGLRPHVQIFVFLKLSLHSYHPQNVSQILHFVGKKIILGEVKNLGDVLHIYIMRGLIFMGKASMACYRRAHRKESLGEKNHVPQEKKDAESKR